MAPVGPYPIVEAATDATDRHALLILVDGISADILEEVSTPYIDAIAREGGFSRGYVGGVVGGVSESPTISAVGYNHMLTGTWSHKHNVWTNDIHEPNYHYWNLFRLAAEQRPELRTAIYSSWTENRTHLIGEGHAAAGDITLDISHDGFERDTLAFPHDDQGYFISDIDRHVSELAAKSIADEAPHLSWVYLWYPDATGHRQGENDVHRQSVRDADAQVGLIYEAVQERVATFDEEWLVVVTTDHGRRLPEGQDHGGQSAREREIWYAINSAEVNEYFRRSTPGIVGVYPTIARYLSLPVPARLARELDGTPFMGNVSISSPTAAIDKHSRELTLTWDAWHDDGAVQIFISRTNHFSQGENDRYEHVAEVDAREGTASIDVSEHPSHFYKVVLEGEHNMVSTWVTP